MSTTVDPVLLAQARRVLRGKPDAELFDRALEAFLATHRAAEIDASYAAYDEIPFDALDEWGDLATFGDAASRP